MKILVLAGGFDQIALIQELKKRGNKILLADYFENPPAKIYADEFYQVSTLDVEQIFLLAKEKAVELVTTACTDQALMTVAIVSERLHLPCYVDVNMARNVTNKAYMKEKFRNNDIPSAKSYIIESGDESIIEKFPVQRDFSYIVKPCDCNSSKGVIKVNNKLELKNAINNALLLSRSKKAIVESFIPGDELSIDAWVLEGKAQIIAISKTIKMKEYKDSFTIYKSEFPVSLTNAMKDKIQRIVNKVCSAFELKNCPLLVQGILEHDNFWIVEFSTRMGGGSKYRFIQYVSGINIMQKYVDFILGEDLIMLSPIKPKEYYEMDYIYAYNGRIKEISNFDELLEKGQIEEVFYYKTKGDVITGKKVSGDRVLGLLLTGKNLYDINSKRRTIFNKVAIIDDTGKDIMYRKCFVEK